MAERRSLVEGIAKEPQKAKEEEFVYGAGVKQAAPAAVAESAPAPVPNQVARVPLTTRIRADLAQALKRESLKRQLSGVYPQAMQEFIEEALELWLYKNTTQG